MVGMVESLTVESHTVEWLSVESLTVETLTIESLTVSIQLTKKLVSSLAISPARHVKARRQKQNLLLP